MAKQGMHRICLQSWELIQCFHGSVIPREGETLILDREGQEVKYRVTSVMYKQTSSDELAAIVFVCPA